MAGHHHGGAGHRIGGDDGRQSEDLLDEVLSEDPTRGAGDADPAVVHDDHVLGAARGLVEVVQDRYDRAPVGVEASAQLEDVDLVSQVEEGGGLVQEDRLGALGQGQGDPYALALSAAELVDGAGGQLGDPHHLHGLLDGLPVLLRPLAEQALVGEAAAGHEVAHQHAAGHDGALGQQTDPSGHVLGAQAGDVGAVEQHRAPGGPVQPGQGAQQRGLAAGVGPDDGGEDAGRDVDVEVTGDHVALVGDGRSPGGQPSLGGGRSGAGVQLGGGQVGHRDLLPCAATVSATMR